MLNHIVIMGRLIKDPELRRTGSGLPVASFSIACDRDYKSDSGERETDFVDVVAWRSTAEFVSKYFAKGRTAVVSGRLQIRAWTDKDGNKRRTAEIVADNVYFGDSKPDQGAPAYNGFIPQSSTPQAGHPMPPSTPSGLQSRAEAPQFFPAPPLTLEDGEDANLPF